MNTERYSLFGTILWIGLLLSTIGNSCCFTTYSGYALTVASCRWIVFCKAQFNENRLSIIQTMAVYVQLSIWQQTSGTLQKQKTVSNFSVLFIVAFGAQHKWLLFQNNRKWRDNIFSFLFPFHSFNWKPFVMWMCTLFAVSNNRWIWSIKLIQMTVAPEIEFDFISFKLLHRSKPQHLSSCNQISGQLKNNFKTDKKIICVKII